MMVFVMINPLYDRASRGDLASLRTSTEYVSLDLTRPFNLEGLEIQQLSTSDHLGSVRDLTLT
jgi:hypothetical protein